DALFTYTTLFRSQPDAVTAYRLDYARCSLGRQRRFRGRFERVVEQADVDSLARLDLLVQLAVVLGDAVLARLERVRDAKRPGRAAGRLRGVALDDRGHGPALVVLQPVMGLVHEGERGPRTLKRRRSARHCLEEPLVAEGVDLFLSDLQPEPRFGLVGRQRREQPHGVLR